MFGIDSAELLIIAVVVLVIQLIQGRRTPPL